MIFSHIYQRKFIVYNKGFTLVELLIVIAIIATLAGIATPLFSEYIDRVKIDRAKVEIRMISQEISIFYNENNRYPVNLAELGLGPLRDPWGNPYQFLPVAGAKKGKLRKDYSMVPVNQDYDLYSMGKDGKSQPPFTAAASRDDIVRANDGSYIGLVSQY
ncbi:MAG: prepilin-type N-terminal cleavage/methylation domain-containing protein [Desulfurivibrionaceae bacterium]